MTRPTSPTLRFLGAAGTVTGSRYLVGGGDRRVLIDCALFQRLKQLRCRNRKPFPRLGSASARPSAALLATSRKVLTFPALEPCRVGKTKPNLDQ